MDKAGIFKKLTKTKENLKDLSREEAYIFLKAILEKEVSEIKSSAFFTAMRIKGETAEELFGFYEALQEKMLIKNSNSVDSLDVAINYDGKVRSPYILPSAIFIALANGVKITFHGEDGIPVKEGITLHRIFKEMGIKISKNTAFKYLEKCGVSYILQRDFIPDLYALLPLRRELAFRTFLNVLEKLLNPFNSKRIITSVFHKPYLERTAELLRLLGFERWTIVRGLEGGIEPYTDRETEILTREGPLKVDCKIGKIPEVNLSPRAQAELNIKVLKGEEKGFFKDWAIYTGAILLFAYGKVKNFREALEISRETLETKRAYMYLQNCKQIDK
ncbi:MAG: anthranilate phosphoribosyltransferase [Aquifex sp.]|nr:MAG: anthranilate phosphoribosyltransferase [Aquifex sp.]